MKRFLFLWAAGLLGSCATAPVAAPVEAPPAPRGPVRAIQNVAIFDGTQLLPPGNVVFQDGRILAAGAGATIPPGALITDGTGKTLLPGLIDSHVHIWDFTHLRQEAVFGVTTVLDMMNSPGTMIGIRKELASSTDLADFHSAGAAATVPGGHGTQYGFPVPTLTEPAEAASFVDDRIAEGSEYIKIMYDDGKAHGFDWPTLSLPAVKAVIAAAHAAGRMAIVHAGSEREARDVIGAGADGLAHTFADQPPDPALIAEIAAHHAFVVPTLGAIESSTGKAPAEELLASPLAPYLSGSDVAALKKSFAPRAGATICFTNALASVKALAAAHVTLLAGTDAANPGVTYGASLHSELELMVQAGLTPTQALASATSIPADTFKLDDRGRIRPGARADLVLVDGDPTHDIAATQRIAAVWLAGNPVDREGYRASLRPPP